MDGLLYLGGMVGAFIALLMVASGVGWIIRLVLPPVCRTKPVDEVITRHGGVAIRAQGQVWCDGINGRGCHRYDPTSPDDWTAEDGWHCPKHALQLRVLRRHQSSEVA